MIDVSPRPMTQGYLVEAIGYLLAQIKERWPDRVTHDSSDKPLPGTFIQLSNTGLWIGDHYDWDTWTVSDLQRIADRLRWAVSDLEAA